MNSYIRDVCKVGQGPACCRYLSMTGNIGFTCEKLGTLKALLDRRVEKGKMSALGDNCSGLIADVSIERTMPDKAGASDA